MRWLEHSRTSIAFTRRWEWWLWGKHEGLYLTSWELDLRCSRKSQDTTGGHLLLLCCDLFPPVLIYSSPSGGNGIYRGVTFFSFGFLCLYLNFDPISGLSISLLFREHSLSAALRFGRGDIFSRVDWINLGNLWVHSIVSFLDFKCWSPFWKLTAGCRDPHTLLWSSLVVDWVSLHSDNMSNRCISFFAVLMLGRLFGIWRLVVEIL
jgi:hypothetical protein